MNTKRTDGYVTDVAYTTNYFFEHSPSWLNYIAVLNGCRPRPLDRGFTYIDLGCGLGETLNVAAAAFPQGEFYGVDFNPAHVAAAKDHAARWQVKNVAYIAASFQNLSKMRFPRFDFVMLHGIYSWVSEDARRAALAFARGRLKPGGILHLSYNCMPGWTEIAPMQKMLFELAEAADGNSIVRLSQAIPSLEKIAALPSGYFATHSLVRRMVRSIGGLDQAYAAHEYLNANWRACYSCDVINEMRALGLDYIGQGMAVENHLDLMLNDRAAAVAASKPTEALRQLTADFLLGRSFRRDIYVRGRDRLDGAERSRFLRELCFACLTDPRTLQGEVAIPRGGFQVERTLARELKDAFAAGVLPLKEVIARIPRRVASAAEIERAVICLVAGACLMPAARRNIAPGTIMKGRLAIPLWANRQAIGEALKMKMPGLSELLAQKLVLVSPAAGNVVAIDGLDALVVSLRSEVAMPAKEIAGVIWDRIANGGAGGRTKAAAVPDQTAIEKQVLTSLKIVVPALERLGILCPI